MDEKNQNGYEETLTPQDTEVETELELDFEEDNVEDDELAKAKELANNYKIRAEKAESKLKTTAKPEVKVSSKPSELSTLDIIAITKSNIDMDDLPSVQKFAKMEGITIQEALKSDELKAILAIKAEKRNVAQASHSGVSRRSSSTISDDTLLAKASKGELPDSNEDIVRLIRVRKGIRG